MMKENPKIEINEEDGQLLFRYRAKYEIRNKLELYNLIGKTKSGVCMKDVMESYGTVKEDVQEMVQSGDIIACKNKKAKDTILYPRGNSFLTKLSGTASTLPDQNFLSTTEDLTNEIRRGDAVLVGESWCVACMMRCQETCMSLMFLCRTALHCTARIVSSQVSCVFMDQFCQG
jgi:hypothetical protein